MKVSHTALSTVVFTVLSGLILSPVASAKGLVRNNIPAHSNLGKSLLSEARSLNGDEFEFDNSWLADYAIQYQGCTSILQYAGEGEGQGGGREDGESQLYM